MPSMKLNISCNLIWMIYLLTLNIGLVTRYILEPSFYDVDIIIFDLTLMNVCFVLVLVNFLVLSF